VSLRKKSQKKKVSQSPKADRKEKKEEKSPDTPKEEEKEKKESKTSPEAPKSKKEKKEEPKKEEKKDEKKEESKEEAKEEKKEKSSKKKDLKASTSSTSSSPKSPKKEKKEKKSKIAKEGFLEKKGVIRHNWTNRYMILERKKEIRYYKTQQDLSSPKGVIPLENASVYSHVEKKGKEMSTYFNVRVGTRDYLLRASSAEEKASWVKAIKSNVFTTEEKDKKPELKKSNSYLGVVKQ